MHELSAENVVEYARSRGWIGPEEASAEWLSGGVSNCVLRVEQGGRRIIVKQSRPQLRTEREWFSDVARIHREEDVQRLLSEKLPGWVPRVLGSDRDNYAYAMEHAPDGARTWKELLLAGELSLTTARAAGQLLGRIHALSLDDPRLTDGEVFRQLRIEPFYDRVAAVHPDLGPAIRPLVHAMTTLPMGLCHGDYSPKNLLVAGDSMMLVDHETAYLGEPAMDLGFFFSHLLLKAIRMPGWRAAMFGLIRAALGAYTPKGDILWRGLGHLGVCLIARVDGTSPVDYLPSARHQEAARHLGRKILLQMPYDWQTALDWAEDDVRDLEG
jgi:5-methylthioribose kinase